MVIYADNLFNILRSKLKYIEIKKNHKHHNETSIDSYDMIIFGYGRVGFEFVRTAQKTNKNYLVVDYNPETISHMRGDGINFRFGDAEDVEFLDEIGLSKANMVISTIPDIDVNILLVRHYRRENCSGSVIVSSHSISETQSLYNEGATYVIMSHFLGAHFASQMIFEHENDPSVFAKARNIQLSQLSRAGQIS
jgi:voltage-gated potassium channel Kch